MIKSAEKASKILIRDFGELERLQVSKKTQSDFLEHSEFKVTKIINEELMKARPNYSFLAKKIKKKPVTNEKNIWILDPINGWNNFLHGVPHFAISIALQSSDEIICGLIFDPIKDEIFFAEKNNGAFLNNKRIRVSKKKILNECLFAFGNSPKKDLGINYRVSGSSALDMAYLAAGRFDGYLEKNLNLNELAAGIIIITEATGIVNKIDLNSETNKIKVCSYACEVNKKLIDKIEI